MKRLHIHLSVAEMDTSIRFYTALFGCEPGVRKSDYAKWMLDDPRVNFAISNRGAKAGLDHFGIQTEDETELQSIRQQLDKTAQPIAAQQEAACCYMRSNKYWTVDPQGIPWESFHSLNDIPTFNESGARSDGENPFAEPAQQSPASSCCARRQEGE